MNREKACVAFIVLLTCAFAGQALAHGPEYKSNADNLTKIRSVLEEFCQDIIHKDGYAITKLILNPDVLFHHINNQEEADTEKETSWPQFKLQPTGGRSGSRLQTQPT